MGYSNSLKKEDGTPEEGNDVKGIMYNHAYGMLRIEDLTATDNL